MSFERLEELIPGWQAELDVAAMTAHLLETCSSLYESFQAQFETQFRPRFDLESEDGEEAWGEITDALEDCSLPDIEDLFPTTSNFLWVEGHPGAMLDFLARWSLIEQGASGVMYKAAGADEGLEVVRAWKDMTETELNDLLAEELLYLTRDIIENPSSGWSITCNLERERLIVAFEEVIGHGAEAWRAALVGVLDGKPWVTPAWLAGDQPQHFGNEHAVEEFVANMRLGSATLSEEELTKIQDVYFAALAYS